MCFGASSFYRCGSLASFLPRTFFFAHLALPGAPQTLAQALGISVEPVINFKTAADIAQGLQGGTTPKTLPVISESPVGPCKVADMPLDLLDVGENPPQKLKHIVHLIPEFAEPYDWSEISRAHASEQDRQPEATFLPERADRCTVQDAGA